MSAGGTVLLTQEGWRRFHAELRSLEEQRASAFGERPLDRRMAEPADAAWVLTHSETAPLDRRIAELRAVLSRAAPAVPDGEPGTVGIGSRMVVRWDDGEEETYTIVGPPEVDPRGGRISYECPVGQAVVGRRAGEQVDVLTASGPARLEVLAVE